MLCCVIMHHTKQLAATYMYVLHRYYIIYIIASYIIIMLCIMHYTIFNQLDLFAAPLILYILCRQSERVWMNVCMHRSMWRVYLDIYRDIQPASKQYMYIYMYSLFIWEKLANSNNRHIKKTNENKEEAQASKQSKATRNTSQAVSQHILQAKQDFNPSICRHSMLPPFACT